MAASRITTQAGPALLTDERILEGMGGRFDLHTAKDAMRAFKIHGPTGRWKRGGRPFSFVSRGLNGLGEPPAKLTTCASLFAGGGGWEVGAAQAGLKSLWAIELDDGYAAIHKANFPDCKMYVAAVKDVPVSSLPMPDVMFVSPPCQEASLAATKRKERHCQADAGFEAVPFIEWGVPVVIMENGPEYMAIEKDPDDPRFNDYREPAFGALLQAFNKTGYAYDLQVIPLGMYGVPQQRRRLILRAARNRPLPPLAPAQVPKLSAKTYKINSWYSVLKGHLISHYQDFVRQDINESNMYWIRTEPPPAWPVLVAGSNTSTRSYRKPDESSMIIASADAHNSSRVAFKKRDGTIDSIKFTPRMAAYLQTFPRTYKLPVDDLLRNGAAMKDAFNVIGNAVPPLAAYWLVQPFMV